MPIIKSFRILVFCCLISNLVHGQVTADFTYTASSGCGSLPVEFCDNSTSTVGAIVSWQWDIGGATPSTECASRIFGSPGKYTICLTVTDSGGNSDQECKTDLITVYNLPVADFDASPQQGCVPLDVTFIDLSTSQDGVINDWLWGLGGSCGTVVGTGATPAALCTYDIPDSYTISLTVTDDNGCRNTMTKTNFIEVSPLPDIAVVTNDTFGCDPPHTVSFTNNGNPSTTNYTWNFGNTQSFSGHTPPPIVYNNNGSYTVSVIAENNATGCRDTTVYTDLIKVGYDVGFVYNVQEGCEDLTVSFTDQSTEPADSVVWDFGNGAISRLPTPSYTYTDPGCYTPRLRRYIDGCLTEVTSNDCIQVYSLPEATYNNNNSIGCELPHVVNFAGVALTGDITSWSWDFGDGSFSTFQNPVHSYNSFGDFIVTLTVTNANNCSYSVSVNPISIVELQADIAPTPVEGCAPLDFTLVDNSSSITSITDWEWTINTGSNVYTANGSSGMFSIPDTGVFDVTLQVTNTLGCTDTETFPNMVTVGMLPTINFSASSLEECIEVPITFTDLSDPYVEEWRWQFGDGDESFIQNPVHEFQDTGYYDIILTGTHNGCSNTLTLNDYIHILEPLAKFDFLMDCDDFTRVEFVDRSVGAENVFWDFGVPGVDTDTSSVFSPTFVFPGPGDYEVTQTAFNSKTACEHSTTKIVRVTNPKAIFTPSAVQGCWPMTINMQDQSEFAVRWEWTAPGGNISNFLAPEPSILYNTPGKYTDIKLVITDVNGCLDSLTFTDTIYVNAITVDFVANPLSGCLPLEVAFTDQSSNLFANNLQWSWEYTNDPNRIDEQNPLYTFTNTGYHDVTLTVRDSWGCSASITRDSVIDVTDPVAAFYTEDTLSCTDHCVTFVNTSAGKGMTYYWDFGDGSTSADLNPTHCYTADGDYTVCLTVTDVYGCDSTFCINDYVTIADPVAAFTSDSTFASCPPLPVSFTNTSQNASSYLWDFGDGSGLTSVESPDHVYTVPGTYEVTLIATNTPYCHDTLTFDDLIVLEGPEGDFSFTVDSTCAPVRVTFIANTIANYTYVWDFGDGNVQTTPATQMTDTVVYYYTDAGEYIPAISFVDNNDCQRTLTSPQSIRVSEMNLDFQGSETILCDVPGGSTITFTNLSFSSDLITSFEWDFGGGNPGSSTALEPTSTFTNLGAYDVMLIGDNGFCRDTLIKPGYIGIGPSPQADFSMDVTSGCDPLTVQFTDQSTVSLGAVSRWEWIFGDGDSSMLQNPDHIFGAGNNIPIQLVAISDVGCTDTLVQTINVDAQTPVSAGEDQVICIGNRVRLDASVLGDTTGMTYAWTPAVTLDCPTCLRPVANPVDTTTYTFVATNASGCTSTSEMTVNVKPFTAPVVGLTSNTQICANDVIQLYVTGGDDVFSYQWDETKPGLTCYQSCNNPIAQPLQTTTYVVSVTNAAGCETIDSVTIEVIDQYQPFAGEDRTICYSGTTQLDASFGNNPQWLVTDGLSCTFCPNPSASPNETTTYVVKVTTDDGCEVFDSITVNVVQPEDVDAGEDTQICLGSEMTLEGVGTGVASWSPATGLSDPASLFPEASPTVTTTYYLTVTNGECIATDSVTITVADKVDISVNDVTICEGDTAILDVIGEAESFVWLNTTDLSDPNSPEPLATPSDTTNYAVVGSFSTCESDTAYVTVNVIPEPNNLLLPVQRFFPGQTVELNIRGRGFSDYEYEWSPREGLNCGGCIGPEATPDSTITYTLTVIDPSTGCTNTKSTELIMMTSCPDDLIWAPNIFTPNNDGNNDEFEIFLSSAVEGITSYRIYDRWGALMFETTDPFETWDGTYKGKEAPQGVYLYMIESVCQLSGQPLIKTGDITLIR